MKPNNCCPVENLPSLDLPLGTIISWVTKVSGYEGETIDLPPGWQRCDGSTIEHPSPWAGMLTPDLNNQKRFLRGGHDNEQLTLEDDQMQEHAHLIDITDPGHSHPYIDDHFHASSAGLGPSASNYNQDRFQYLESKTTTSGNTGISATVDGVRTGRHGAETRPKNMNVIYIIRVF